MRVIRKPRGRCECLRHSPIRVRRVWPQDWVIDLLQPEHKAQHNTRNNIPSLYFTSRTQHKLHQLPGFVCLLLREETEQLLMRGDGVPHFVTYSWHDTIYFLFTQKIKLVYLSPEYERSNRLMCYRYHVCSSRTLTDSLFPSLISTPYPALNLLPTYIMIYEADCHNNRCVYRYRLL